MNERIRDLKKLIIKLNADGVRRSTFYPLVAESLKATQGEPRMIRRAKALAHILDKTPPVILPHETVVGSVLGAWPLAEGLPSYEDRRSEAVAVIEGYRARKIANGGKDSPNGGRQRWALMARDHYNNSIDYHDLQRLIDEMCERFAEDALLSHREIGRELERHFNFDYGPECKRLMEELPWNVANHLDLHYAKSVTLGFGPTRDAIREKLDAATDPEQRELYEAALISLEAAICFTHKYADAARGESARPESRGERSRELLEIADVLDQIAEKKPESFREAIQFVWMHHLVAHLGGGSALSFARFDQYMIPFYKRDIEAGAITREQAKEWISCVWLKVNEPKMRTVQSMCLAGTTPDGRDGSNELSELCLEVCAEMHMPYPNLSVRVAKNSPEWLMDRVAQTLKAGIGHPMVLNDDMWIPNFHNQGYPLAESRQYYNMGCVEMMLQGTMPNWGGGTGLDFPAILELVFRNGEENMIGEKGIETGDLESFKTFEDFMKAYEAQIRFALLSKRPGIAANAAQKSHFSDPFSSIWIEDCLERGRDVFRGGSRFSHVRACGGFGLGTATDALSAIKTFVFDERRITLPELWRAMQNNYREQDELRRMLESGTPCFGNDNDEVDQIARRVFDVFADTVHSMNGPDIPGKFTISVFSYNHHVYAGEAIEAMPNGRPRSEPISDAIGPSQGRDQRGPSCLINSITKLDHRKVTGAYAFNMRFTESVVKGQTGSETLKSVIRTLFAKGGVQVQINVADDKALLEARDHPEKHADLVVRVAGYSEFFVNLDRRLQDEIIRRTAHAV